MKANESWKLAGNWSFPQRIKQEMWTWCFRPSINIPPLLTAFFSSSCSIHFLHYFCLSVFLLSPPPSSSLGGLPPSLPPSCSFFLPSSLSPSFPFSPSSAHTWHLHLRSMNQFQGLLVSALGLPTCVTVTSTFHSPVSWLCNLNANDPRLTCPWFLLHRVK